MSQKFQVNAEVRVDEGKGASRRLRRTGMVPGIAYGGHQEPQMISVRHSSLIRQLDNEAFYSSLLTLSIDGVETQVVLKDLQRHPAKPFVLHVDFQRVDMGQKLRMVVPIHFENEAKAQGVKMGGNISHNVTEIEVTCLPKDLPEFIVVDVLNMDVHDIVHVSELQLPDGVELTHALDPETPVVIIHPGYSGDEDEEGEEAESEDPDGAS